MSSRRSGFGTTPRWTRAYEVKIKGETVAKGEVLPDYFLAIGASDDEGIEGIETTEPAFGIGAKWVDKENAEKAKIFGYSVIDPLSVIATHFSEVILSHASELLGRKEVNLLLEHMKKTDRFVVDDIVPSAVSVGELHKVLGNLLEEKIPIRDLSTILQTLGDFATKIKDPELLTEYVRQALKRTITHKFTEDGTLKVITLSEKVENAIMGSV